ncbi:MAG: DinB family protein [Bryobacteraceae bacterium]
MKTIVLLFAVPLISIPVYAQSAQNPLSEGQKGLYNYLKGNLVKAAEKMPEENYGFKPTPEIRSFGQIVGHVADAQYMFCSTVLGDGTKPPGMGVPPPPMAIERSKTSKTDLVKALNDSYAYCDKAYDGMTDAHATEMVKFMGRDMSKLTVLSINNAHDDEHYGNIVTYMRIKGLVPPSSERANQPPKKQGQ